MCGLGVGSLNELVLFEYPKELARQLTIMEHEYFVVRYSLFVRRPCSRNTLQSMPAVECLQYVSTKARGPDSPKTVLDLCIHRFNTVCVSNEYLIEKIYRHGRPISGSRREFYKPKDWSNERISSQNVLRRRRFHHF